MSCEPIRSVLPYLRPGSVDQEPTASCRDAALSLSAHPPTSRPVQLLVIADDSRGLADQLRRAFPAPGYQVRVASSTAGDLRHVGAESPDVVVLDPGLPGPSGLEVHRQVRQIDGRVPVVFVTGAPRAEMAIEAMKQGAYDVLFRRNRSRVETTVFLRRKW
jgi:ActR/RegA family two-component response regulator